MQGDKNASTPDTYYASGGMICVVTDGELVVSRPFGDADTSDIESLINQAADQFDPSLGNPVKMDSLFRLGSTSKMFVGLALAICKEDGLVSYDDAASKYIDTLEDTAAGETTLRQLFTHSGGLLPLHRPGLRERDDETTNATMEEIVFCIGRYFGASVAAAIIGEEKIADWEWQFSGRARFRHTLLFQATVPSEIPGYVLGIIRYPFPMYLAALAITELPYAIAVIYLEDSFLEGKVYALIIAGIAVILL